MDAFEKAISQSSRKPNGRGGFVERRSGRRDPMLRTSSSGMTSNLWELELVPAFGLLRLCDAIDQLAPRSLEHNIFFESTALRAAWPRLTTLLAPQGLWIVCLWETVGEERHMRIVMPVRMNKSGFLRQNFLQPLSNDYMPLGTPLIDRDCAGEAAETLLRLLADPDLKLPRVFDFTFQVAEGESYSVLKKAAESLGLPMQTNLRHERAALFAGTERAKAEQGGLSRKRVRDLARQVRKLEQNGSVTFDCAREQEDILDAVEAFMSLELRGWKGRRGTALYNHKKIAAYSRQIVAELGSKQQCEIFSMKHDGKMIAGLILLGRDGYFVPWKIAFDERFAPSSPGMQVIHHATSMLLDRDDFVRSDSLAIPDHWMMNRVWPHRLDIADLSVGLTVDSGQLVEKHVQYKQRRMRLYLYAKKWQKRLHFIKRKLFGH